MGAKIFLRKFVIFGCGFLFIALSLGACHHEQASRISHLDPPALANANLFQSGDGVPVICYHYFRSRFAPAYLAKVTGSLLFGMPALSDREFWTLPVDEFAKHLQFFQDHDIQVLTLDEAWEMTQKNQALPQRAVILTIDDAEASVYNVAYPLLRRFGMRAHLFVPTASVGHTWSGLHMCTWDQLREMENSGLVILESHTNREHYKIPVDSGYDPAFWHPEAIDDDVRLANLKDLNAIGKEIPGFQGRQWEKTRGGRFQPVIDDLLVSRSQLALQAGAIAHWLAWPYGYGNGDLDSIAALTGFSGTVSLKAQPYTTQLGPWHVGRFIVTAKTTLAQIEALFPQVATGGATLAQNVNAPPLPSSP